MLQPSRIEIGCNVMLWKDRFLSGWVCSLFFGDTEGAMICHKGVYYSILFSLYLHDDCGLGACVARDVTLTGVGKIQRKER